MAIVGLDVWSFRCLKSNNNHTHTPPYTLKPAAAAEKKKKRKKQERKSTTVLKYNSTLNLNMCSPVFCLVLAPASVFSPSWTKAGRLSYTHYDQWTNDQQSLNMTMTESICTCNLMDQSRPTYRSAALKRPGKWFLSSSAKPSVKDTLLKCTHPCDSVLQWNPQNAWRPQIASSQLSCESPCDAKWPQRHSVVTPSLKWLLIF